MFLKQSKVKGKTYHQVFDERGFVAHVGTAEKILKMVKIYIYFEKSMKILSQLKKLKEPVDPKLVAAAKDKIIEITQEQIDIYRKS